jgi:hypothetical protein
VSPEGRYDPAADPLRWLLGVPAWVVAGVFCVLSFVKLLLWLACWAGVAGLLLRLAGGPINRS